MLQVVACSVHMHILFAVVLVDAPIGQRDLYEYMTRGACFSMSASPPTTLGLACLEVYSQGEGCTYCLDFVALLRFC